MRLSYAQLLLAMAMEGITETLADLWHRADEDRGALAIMDLSVLEQSDFLSKEHFKRGSSIEQICSIEEQALGNRCRQALHAP